MRDERAFRLILEKIAILHTEFVNLANEKRTQEIGFRLCQLFNEIVDLEKELVRMYMED